MINRTVAAAVIAAILVLCGGAIAFIILDPLHPEATVTGLADGPGHVAGSGSYDTGLTVTITAVPDDGAAFVSWEDGYLGASRKVTVATDVYFTAVFTDLNVVTTECNSDYGAVIGGNSVRPGESVTLTAEAVYGHVFTGWYVDGTLISTDNPCTYTPTADITVTADFEIEQFAVTVIRNFSDGGTVAGGGNYGYLTEATVTATANEGYTFIGWYVDDTAVTTDFDYTFTVTEAVKLRATYTVPYTGSIATYVFIPNSSWTQAEIDASATVGELGVSTVTWSVIDIIGGTTVFSSHGNTFSHILTDPIYGTLTLTVKYDDGTVVKDSRELTVYGSVSHSVTFWTESNGASSGTNNLKCTVSYTIDFASYLEAYKNNNITDDYDSTAAAIADSTNDPAVMNVLDQLQSFKTSRDLTDSKYALLILRFSQYFPYFVDSSSIYHTGNDYWDYPVQYLYEAQGDCEDSSILCTTLWRAAGFNAAVLFCGVGSSVSYLSGHAMAALGDTFNGHSLGLTGTTYSNLGGTYYVAETTGTESATTTKGTDVIGYSPWGYLSVYALVSV